jgi:hypothetical protein
VTGDRSGRRADKHQARSGLPARVWGCCNRDGRQELSSQAHTVSAGVEAISDDAASVAVIMRITQSSPGAQPRQTMLPLRVSLTKHDENWQVFDVTPVNPAPGSQPNTQPVGDRTDQRADQTEQHDQTEQPGDQSGDHI